MAFCTKCGSKLNDGAVFAVNVVLSIFWHSTIAIDK